MYLRSTQKFFCPLSLSVQANFARAVASLSKAQAKKVARFLPNPERHWGPKLRAGRQITSKHVSLLGPQALNGINHHEEGGDEPEAKRKKTEDPPLVSWKKPPLQNVHAPFCRSWRWALFTRIWFVFCISLHRDKIVKQLSSSLCPLISNAECHSETGDVILSFDEFQTAT